MTPLGPAEERLAATIAAVESLGPILELDRRWRGNPATVEEAKKIRAGIREVLDRPHCAYDDAALDLVRALRALPLTERAKTRTLVGERERRALVPYGARGAFLALEERSAERLTSGLVVKALYLPDEDDYRDVMISLAPDRVVAGELGLDAAAIFDEAATFAGSGVADTFRGFGRRETRLGAFGWAHVQTGHGERFHLLL